MAEKKPFPGFLSVRVASSLTKKGKETIRDVVPVLMALLGSIFIGGLLMLAAGHNPLTTYYSLIYGALGDRYNISATLGRTVPIIGCGIAAAIAFKAGLFNIGGEGQFVLGGLGASLVALFFPQGIFAIVLAMAVAAIFGGVWGFMSGWFQTRFKVPILIGSLLMNYVAGGIVSYMISFPLLEAGGSRNQTPLFPTATRFAKIVPGSTLHWGILVIILIVILVSYLMYKTVPGYELRMFGANREFAEAGGINATRVTLLVMLASGMIAGIAGGSQVLGVHYRLIDTALTLPSYAWSGVMAAILSNNNPAGVVLASLFFSAVQTGASGMERATNIPFELSYVVQAIMIILIAVRATLKPTPKGESL